MSDSFIPIYLATARMIVNDAIKDDHIVLKKQLFHKYVDKSQTIEFDISHLSVKIDSIAFQPMAQHCVIDLEHLFATTKDGNYVPLHFTTNGEWNNGNSLIFATIDPMVYLSSEVPWAKLKSITIRVSYKVTDLNTLKFLFGYMLLSDKLTIIGEETNAAKVQVNMIKDSLSYKLGFALTAPLRWGQSILKKKPQRK